MAGLSLLDARRLARAGAGLQSTDGLFTDPVMNDIVNEAAAIAEGEVRPPWRQVTATAAISSGTPDVTPMPTNWAETKTVFEGENELDEVSISDLLSFGTTLTGAPRFWTQDADAIRIRPKPAGSYTLTWVYYRVPPLLVADADTTLMPADLAISIIVPKACELVLLRQGDRVLADAKAAAYATAMPRLRKRARGSSGPMKVRVRPGSWI